MDPTDRKQDFYYFIFLLKYQDTHYLFIYFLLHVFIFSTSYRYLFLAKIIFKNQLIFLVAKHQHSKFFFLQLM